MNIFIITVIGIAIVSTTIFSVFMIDDNTAMHFPKEHYSITITGLEDTYPIGEPYSFSYVLSGVGNSCGGKKITFPVNKTHNTTIASSASCAKAFPTNFVLDIKETHGTTYGHIPLQEAGTYTVSVQFERGSNGPTVTEKTFTITNP